MADYSGNTTGNITAVDGDTFGSSGQLNIKNTHIVTIAAGATVISYQAIAVEAGGTLTVNPGATIKVADYKALPYVSGTFNCVGTKEAPITFRANTVDATTSTWSGFCIVSADNAVVNIDYTIVQNCSNVCYFGGNYTGVTFNVNRLWLKCLQYGFNDNAAWAGSSLITNVICENSGEMRVGYGTATASRTLDTAYFIGCMAQVQPTIGTNIVNNLVSVKNSSNAINLTNGATSTTFSDCYFGSVGNQNAISVGASSNTSTVQRSVFYKPFRGVMNNQASSVTTFAYNDLVECPSNAFYTNNSTAALNSSYDYVVGCNKKPLDLVDTGSPGTQSWQQAGAITRTNQATTPNKPLTIDNIAVGTPTTSGVTITFDSAAGATGYRRKGIGFVKYGTISGTYNMSTAPNFSVVDLAKYWTTWDTSYVFNTTGHSVTLNNLESGTTYFAVPCFVDPLGLVATGAEQTFTTVDDELTRNTDPGANNVIKDVSYKIANVSKTGTFDEAGRNVDPGESNVKDTTTYKILNVDRIGTYVAACDYPLIGNVRYGVVFDSGARTGNMTLPSESQTKSGVSYGALGEEYTGNVTLPLESNVKLNIQYGSSGLEFKGTLDNTYSSALQAEVDLLRTQLLDLQSDISTREKKSDVNTLNTVLSSSFNTIVIKLTDLEECVRELQSDLIDARQLLITHTH